MDKVNNTDIIPTMFQKVMQGTATALSIADAEEQIKRVYAKNPVQAQPINNGH